MRTAGALVVAGLVVLGGCGSDEAARERGVASEAPAPEREREIASAPATELPAGATRPAAGDEVPGPETPRSAPPAAPDREPVGQTSAGGGAGEAEADAAEPGADAAEPGTPSPEEILRATARAYEGLRSFRAEFEQTLRNTILGRTTTSRGTLYQRQPDRFLMAFSDPADDLIVSDGEWFWMYFPSVDETQVIRTLRGAQGLDLHSQFIGDPVRRFETTYHGTETVRGRRAHVLTLVPREAAGYERLKVWIDARDHLVRRFELTETNGNVRHFQLWDLVKNPSLDDELFAFTPPAGAQVVTR